MNSAACYSATRFRAAASVTATVKDSNVPTFCVAGCRSAGVGASMVIGTSLSRKGSSVVDTKLGYRTGTGKDITQTGTSLVDTFVIMEVRT